MDLIDIYEKVNNEELSSLEEKVRKIISGNEIKDLQIETTKGFAYLFDKYLGIRSASYPIPLTTEGVNFLYELPIIFVDKQTFTIYDNVINKVIFDFDISKYWSRYHKIYLKFIKDLQPAEYLNIENYLNQLGIDLHNKTPNINVYEVSVQNKNLEIKATDNFSLQLITPQYIY